MSRMMRFALLLISFAIPISFCHIIEVRASQKECFFEDLHVNDKVRVMFIVIAIFNECLYR